MERQIRFAKLVLMAGIVCFLSAGMLLAQRSYKWEVVEETQIEPDTRNSRVKFSSPSESQAGRMRFTPKVGRQNISGQQEPEKQVNDAELTPMPKVERGTIRRLSQGGFVQIVRFALEDTTSLYTFVDDEVKPPVKKAYILYDRNGDRLGPLKFRQENVYLEAMYGNGAYIGRTDTGKLHIVHLGQDIYKVVDVLAAGEEYYCPTYGCTGGGAFIETTEDMLFEYPKRKNGKIMSDFYLISKNGEILWKRSYNGEVVYNVLSPDGSYVALMYTIPVQKETWDEPRIVPFEGEVEIIRRDGTTVSTFQTGFSSSRDQFSQDNEYILFREQHQVIKVFAVQTGELVNRILFPGSRPVEEVVLNKPLGVIAVLRNVTSGWGGERRITVVPIEGTAKRPVWEYSLGEFDRRSDDFSHFTHLSISHDGSEISVLSNKKYLRFERVE